MWVSTKDYISLKAEVASLKAQLEAEVNRRERAELDFQRQNEDFKSLVALTAGRVPPKMKPEFDKDPWEEDPRLPETFLTPPDKEIFGEEAEDESKENGD